MSRKSDIQNDYLILNDRIIYNQLYALKYPPEDNTNLELEYREILTIISHLKNQLVRDYSQQQLNFAISEINIAFDLYRNGQDGFRNLEFAIAYIKSSGSVNPPKATFEVDPEGILKPMEVEKDRCSNDES